MAQLEHRRQLPQQGQDRLSSCSRRASALAYREKDGIVVVYTELVGGEEPVRANGSACTCFLASGSRIQQSEAIFRIHVRSDDAT